MPQSGVIPYRRTDGQIDVMLITSSRRRRWTIPKGHIKAGLSPVESAGEEAWEEAGIRGLVSQDPVGHYVHAKRGMLLSVAVYSMQVEGVHEIWPEQWKRRRQWMSLSESIAVIEDAGLQEVLARFELVLTAIQVDG
jgi:8-oxo-dGTP pyrophosphatase MutT (NUDIX family)